MKGLVGSTDSTPTVSPSVRRCPQSAETRVDLPEPGGPVRPMCAARPVCGKTSAISSAPRGSESSSRLIARATARRSPSRTRRASSTGSPARRRPSAWRVTSVRSRGSGARHLLPRPRTARRQPTRATRRRRAGPARRDRAPRVRSRATGARLQVAGRTRIAMSAPSVPPTPARIPIHARYGAVEGSRAASGKRHVVHHLRESDPAGDEDEQRAERDGAHERR